MTDYPDIHMNTAKNINLTVPDIRMTTAKGPVSPAFNSGDIRMDTARPATTVRQGPLQLWEKELIESVEVRRKSTVAQLCEFCFIIWRLSA